MSDPIPDANPLSGLAAALTQGRIEKLVREALDQALLGVVGGSVTEVVAANQEAIEKLAKDAAEEQLGTAFGDVATGPELRFHSVPEFVEHFVIPNWRHGINDESRWCATWWEHSEAMMHLEALWEAFETMRASKDGTSSSDFLLRYFNPTMEYLTSRQGPFVLCDASSGKHAIRQLWPVNPAPEGLFEVYPTPADEPVMDAAADATDLPAGFAVEADEPDPTGDDDDVSWLSATATNTEGV